MATVVKNFRIKSGLIVEGTTGTINGQNILTETGGNSYILNLVGGATLVKSVDTNVFNVDGSGNLTINSNTFDAYGAASSAQTAAAADATTKANAAQAAAEATAAADATTKANSAESNAIFAAATDATNKANAALADAQSYANTAAGNAYTDAVADAQTFANNAYNNATDYADGILTQANGYTNSAIGTEVGDRNAAISSAISTEVSDRNSAISTAITNLNLAGTYDALGAASQALTDANSYTNQEIAALVDSAPALLDTLSELASAIANNPNYATDVANLVAGKQDTLSAGNGIVIDNNDVIYVPTYLGSGITVTPSEVEIDRTVVDTWYDTAGAASSAQTAAAADATTKANAAQAAAEATAAADATTKANAAQAAAEATAAADATTKANAAQAAAEATAASDATTKANAAQAAAEGFATTAASNAQTNAENFASGLVSDLLDATTPFTDLNINDVAKQVAARVTSLGSVAVTAYQFNKSAFKSGKFLVKIDNGTHNEISEILVTLDSADNIAITEYAIVGTNGSRGTITADINNSHCRIRVTPVNDSTITVSGTIFNS